MREVGDIGVVEVVDVLVEALVVVEHGVDPELVRATLRLQVHLHAMLGDERVEAPRFPELLVGAAVPALGEHAIGLDDVLAEEGSPVLGLE